MHRVLKVSCLAALVASTVAPAAQAGVIDFSSISNVVTPVLSAGDSIYAGHDQFAVGGLLATISDSAYAQGQPDYEPGLAGAWIDPNSAACLEMACPAPWSPFYGALNGGSVSFAREDGAGFRLNAFDFGFIGVNHDMPDARYGKLLLTLTTAAGDVISLERDLPGKTFHGTFGYDTWTFDGQLGQTTLSSVSFSSCIFDGAGGCVNNDSTLNVAQFALDNLTVSAVPEPSSIALLMGGLAALGLRSGMRRRRGQGGAA